MSKGTTMSLNPEVKNVKDYLEGITHVEADGSVSIVDVGYLCIPHTITELTTPLL